MNLQLSRDKTQFWKFVEMGGLLSLSTVVAGTRCDLYR